MGFELIVLGVGDAFSQCRYPAALLLSCEGYLLAIDCPDRYRAVLHDASKRSGRSLDLARIDDFLITHVHGDHMSGIEMIGFYKRFVEGGERIRLHTTEEVREVIWDERLKGSMGVLSDGRETRQMVFEDFFDYRPLDWQGNNRVGPFSLNIRRTKHHVPTTALMIEASGRKLGYSCDTAFDPELIAFLEPADLIVHETNFGPCHTDIEQLNGLSTALRRKMRLIHYPDEFERDCSDIVPLDEGEIITV